MDYIANKNFDDFVYIDESGIDDNETYPYAWGPRGKRIDGMKFAQRKKRLSIIGALNKNKLQAPLLFEGSCNREVFTIYLKKCLIPKLKPGQIVILDNASFHKGGEIVEIIESAGCEALYLPPYSPDLNPIEHHWSSLKFHIKQALKKFKRDLYRAAEYVFSNILTEG